MVKTRSADQQGFWPLSTLCVRPSRLVVSGHRAAAGRRACSSSRPLPSISEILASFRSAELSGMPPPLRPEPLATSLDPFSYGPCVLPPRNWPTATIQGGAGGALHAPLHQHCSLWHPILSPSPLQAYDVLDDDGSGSPSSCSPIASSLGACTAVPHPSTVSSSIAKVHSFPISPLMLPPPPAVAPWLLLCFSCYLAGLFVWWTLWFGFSLLITPWLANVFAEMLECFSCTIALVMQNTDTHLFDTVCTIKFTPHSRVTCAASKKKELHVLHWYDSWLLYYLICAPQCSQTIEC